MAPGETAVTERVWHIPEDRKQLTRKQIAELFLRQQGLCPICDQKLNAKGHMPLDFIDEHMLPLSMQGTNDMSNRALVCKPCAKVKTAREAGERAKALSVRDRHIGAARRQGRPLMGTKASGYRKRMDGTVERRED